MTCLSSVCNNKQRSKNDKCRCESKELIDKGICDKGEYLDVGEYLDYKNCKCRKKLIDKLVEECIENFWRKTIFSEMVFNSYTIYIVLFVIFLIISTSIRSACIYFHWYLKKDILNYIK